MVLRYSGSDQILGSASLASFSLLPTSSHRNRLIQACVSGLRLSAPYSPRPAIRASADRKLRRGGCMIELRALSSSTSSIALTVLGIIHWEVISKKNYAVQLAVVCSDTGSEARFGLCDRVQVDEEREEKVGCLLKLGLEQCCTKSVLSRNDWMWVIGTDEHFLEFKSFILYIIY